jgi:hypothetical protein
MKISKYIQSLGLIYLIGVFIFLFSCKKEQPALSKTDCGCAKEVSADFKIEEISWYGYDWEKRTETDTIFSSRNVNFKAILDGANYQWIIGSEIINSNSFVRYFGPELKGQVIPIKLVISKKPNTICLPNDDGMDTLQKFLIISEISGYENNTLLTGTFRMKSPLLSDSIDIITKFTEYAGMGFMYEVYNFDGQGSICVKAISNYQMNYRQIWFDNAGSDCKSLSGNIFYKLNNEVEMNLTTGIQEYNNIKKYLFKGRKL